MRAKVKKIIKIILKYKVVSTNSLKSYNTLCKGKQFLSILLYKIQSNLIVPGLTDL